MEFAHSWKQGVLADSGGIGDSGDAVVWQRARSVVAADVVCAIAGAAVRAALLLVGCGADGGGSMVRRRSESMGLSSRGWG